jgi:hypothetical protein
VGIVVAALASIGLTGGSTGRSMPEVNQPGRGAVDRLRAGGLGGC